VPPRAAGYPTPGARDLILCRRMDLRHPFAQSDQDEKSGLCPEALAGPTRWRGPVSLPRAAAASTASRALGEPERSVVGASFAGLL